MYCLVYVEPNGHSPVEFYSCFQTAVFARSFADGVGQWTPANRLERCTGRMGPRIVAVVDSLTHRSVFFRELGWMKGARINIGER